MPFLLAEILNFQGSTHHIGVGSFSKLESETDRGEDPLAACGRMRGSHGEQ